MSKLNSKHAEPSSNTPADESDKMQKVLTQFQNKRQRLEGLAGKHKKAKVRESSSESNAIVLLEI